MAKGSKPAPLTNWHPDFRIADTLPDVKPVRTKFIINAVVLTVALGMLGWLAYIEISASTINGDNERLQTKIDKNSSADRKAKSVSKDFGKIQALTDDVGRFYESRYNLQEIFSAIAEACPKNFYYSSVTLNHSDVFKGRGKKRRVEARGLAVTIRGVLQGARVREIDDFESTIKELDILKKKLAEVTVSTPREGTRPLTFEFTMTLVFKEL